MKKKTGRIISLLLALMLMLSSFPITSFAQTTVDLNDNYLFRQRTNAFHIVAGERTRLDFKPQYTADYTLSLWGHVSGGRNIRFYLYDSEGNELANCNDRTSNLDHATITYTLEKGKSYYYEVQGWLSTTECNVDIEEFTSTESGLLDDENGLKVRFDKTQFVGYNPQEVLDNLFLIIYDAQGISFVWRYKDAVPNLQINGIDVIIDMSACGACGPNTITVSYAGYTEKGEFNINHDFSVFVSHVDPTPDSQGYDIYKCSNCDEQTKTNFVDYTDSYKISTQGTDMGTLRFNDVDVTGGGSVDVKKGTSCTLSATPNDSCSFVGWQYSNKLVSSDAQYNFIPFSDAEYNPVFSDNSNTKTFIFMDTFSNVISYQTVDDPKDVVVPKPPVYSGYKFLNWSYSEEQIHNANSSLTIYAVYESDNSVQYNVNASGCSIEVDGALYSDSAQVPYGSWVTVTSPDATAFLCDGKIVGYGNIYSFYVSSDITLDTTTDDVEQIPVVSIVAKNYNENSGRVEFSATRSVVGEGNELVASGFVYGKNMNDADLTVENVGKTGTGNDSGTVKMVINRDTNPDGQFILVYGISSKVGDACAKAFVTYKDSEGKVNTVYSDMVVYSY